MESVLLLICLLLVVCCVTGDVHKAVLPPLKNLTRLNTAIVTGQPAIYWQDDFCVGIPDKTYFPNVDGCEYFWVCIDEVLELGECPEDMLFDSVDLVCDYDNIICWEPEVETEEPEIPNPDSECPPRGSTDIVFLPSKNCNEYYICHNGVPNLFFCRPGSHWNADKEFCDLPANAGCNDIGGPDTPLPDCRMGFVGSVPHPWNCNWFVFCSNGNRSLQQCPHLQHFDVEQGRCLLITKAICINDL